MMYDIPIPNGITYLIVKICVLILVMLFWLSATATPVA